MILTILKDTHFRFGFKHPSGRTEKFEEQIYNKLKQVKRLANKRNSTTLVVSGDIVDVKQNNLYGFNQVRKNLEVFYKLQKQFNRIYSIMGNHDTPYSSREYKADSFYQFLIDQGCMLDLATQIYDLHTGYHLSGIDFTPSTDQLLTEIRRLDQQMQPGNELILVIHEHCVPTQKDKIPFGTCITYPNLVSNLLNVRTIICGHLHKGFPVKHIINNLGKEITVINQWNFTRLARDYYTVNGEHIPEVVFYNTETHETETVPLEVAPYEEAFIEKELKQQEQLSMDISEFIDKIYSVEESIHELEHIPEEIREKINHYITKAKEQ